MIVWNRVTRLIHWAVALPILFNYLIEGGDKAHKVLGYLAFAFVILRLIWGLISTDEANFKKFAFNIKEFGHKKFQGHNPIASWIYLLIWAIALGLGITGYMMGLDSFWGDERLEKFHELLATCLQLLIGIHFLGIFFDSWKFKRKTWLGMITGKKE
ncbi:MAG: cytochrome b/b6 domain-containing protein [Bacteriovoracaceae bacterium]